MADASATPAQTLGIGITTDVGAVANALAAIFKMGDAIFEALNSPQVLALRQSQDVQNALAKMDADLAAAQKTGDISVIDKEASG
jgi:hypothetical protein